MGAKDKKRFEDMAAKDKVRFDKEMANYHPSKEAGGKRKKDPNAPKRALYAKLYYFCVVIHGFLRFSLTSASANYR